MLAFHSACHVNSMSQKHSRTLSAEAVPTAVMQRMQHRSTRHTPHWAYQLRVVCTRRFAVQILAAPAADTLSNPRPLLHHQCAPPTGMLTHAPNYAISAQRYMFTSSKASGWVLRHKLLKSPDSSIGSGWLCSGNLCLSENAGNRCTRVTACCKHGWSDSPANGMNSTDLHDAIESKAKRACACAENSRVLQLFPSRFIA